MSLWPRPPDESPPLDLATITREIEAFGRGALASWEAGYLRHHWQRYRDTLRLLPPGRGRHLLDIGSFPGHLSVLAQALGWEVTGLNHDIEGATSWTAFLERCRQRNVEILACQVERDRFPAPTATFDAVLFCELFEHLYLNPFHTLKEIFRVLKPGGLLILTTPNMRRAETLFRYLHGWGHELPVSRPFFELFPSLLYHRHNREYTANELAYYLARQGKDLYEFRLDRVYHSDSRDDQYEIPAVLGQRPGRLERAVERGLRRLVPSTRGQLIARAWRTGATIVEWDALGAVEGFGPLQEDEQPDQGFTRRLTFPFRIAGPRASLQVPLPAGSGPTLVSLIVAHPDVSAPVAWTRWTLDGQTVMTLELRPGPRPVRVRLFVPAALAARGLVRLGIETSAGPDAGPGRNLRLHVGSQWVLVERLDTRDAVETAIERVRAERQAEESLEGWWWAAESLYVPHRTMPAAIEMGPADETQLGPGWHHCEDWGNVGAMRWTGYQAVAYLATPGRATALRARVYSGPPELGSVAGRFVVDHIGADGIYHPAGERAFALPPDTWDELSVPIPSTPGRLRLTIHADALRVPRERMPGSPDGRKLGLAVKRVWLV